ANRMRRMSDAFVDACGDWLAAQGLTAPPRSASTLRLLAEGAPLSVTQIAARIRLSHPFVVRMVASLEHIGLVAVSPDAADGRRRMVALTRKGREEAAILNRAGPSMAAAYAELFADAGVDLFAALEAVEAAHRRRSLAQRLCDLTTEDSQCEPC
ncbi:MAG TPA: MarR family transcriptional regulator, partial [Phenylobacterium sp.]